jgi:hypothetical protein
MVVEAIATSELEPEAERRSVIVVLPAIIRPVAIGVGSIVWIGVAIRVSPAEVDPFSEAIAPLPA